MNKITITTIEYIKEYLDKVNEPANKETDPFYSGTCYTDVFHNLVQQFDNGEYFTANSIFIIFELLSAESTRTYQQIKDELRFIDNENKDITLTSKDEVKKEALFHILNFINLSIYLSKQINQKDLKTLLMVMAINIYDNLYSQRGKMEFAYYFNKLLNYHGKPYTSITAYKSNSWRREYGQYIEKFKEYVDTLPLSSYGDRMDETHINNIVIVCGQMKDRKLAKKEMQYFIKMGTFDIAREDFQPLFSTNFS